MKGARGAPGRVLYALFAASAIAVCASTSVYTLSGDEGGGSASSWCGMGALKRAAKGSLEAHAGRCALPPPPAPCVGTGLEMAADVAADAASPSPLLAPPPPAVSLRLLKSLCVRGTDWRGTEWAGMAMLGMGMRLPSLRPAIRDDLIKASCPSSIIKASCPSSTPRPISSWLCFTSACGLSREHCVFVSLESSSSVRGGLCANMFGRARWGCA